VVAGALMTCAYESDDVTSHRPTIP